MRVSTKDYPKHLTDKIRCREWFLVGKEWAVPMERSWIRMSFHHLTCVSCVMSLRVPAPSVGYKKKKKTDKIHDHTNL